MLRDYAATLMLAGPPFQRVCPIVDGRVIPDVMTRIRGRARNVLKIVIDNYDNYVNGGQEIRAINNNDGGGGGDRCE